MTNGLLALPSKRRLCLPTLAAVLCYAAFAVPASLVLAAEKPNVVLFLVDDMGWVDWQRDAQFNPHGSDVYETPNMLRLARSGVVFDNAYAASPVCSPTRAAIMTGKNPARNRITEWISGGNHSTATLTQPPNWDKNLDDSEATLAEALRGAGYNTGFFGKWHLGQSGNQAANPLNHGFDVNVGGAHFGSPPGGHFAGADSGWPIPGLESGFASDAFLADAVSERAADYVSAQGSQAEPFFMMVSHYAVHAPIQAPESLISKYNSKISSLQNQGVNLQGHTNARYAGLVEKMDESLGRVLDRLEDPNSDGLTDDSVRDNTLIVFASDNGGLLGPTSNRPLREGKGSIYEGGIREPFLVSWTGNSALPNGSGVQGRLSDARTSAHDIYSTVLDAAGVLDDGVTPQTTAAQRDGVSILPALRGEAFDRGHQFWHYPHFSNQDNNSQSISGGSYVSAVRKDNWKLIYDYDTQDYELYDLQADLGETTNVFANNRTVAAELSNALRSYLIDIDAQMPIRIADGQPVDPPPAIAPFNPVASSMIIVPSTAAWTTGQSQYSAQNIFASDRGLVNGSTVEHLDPVPATFPLHRAANGVSPGNSLPPGEDAVDANQVMFRTFHNGEDPPHELIVEFDDTYDVTGMALWNFAAKWNGSYSNDRGLKDVQIFASTDGGVTYSPTPAVTLTNIAKAAEQLITEADVIEFGEIITANALRLEIVNHGGTFTGVNELRFIAAAPILYGDYTDDGIVDAADYAVWRDNLGGPAGSLANRFPDLGDTPIGDDDYEVWRLNYGASRSGTPADGNQVIPEASSAAILLPGCLSLLRRIPR